VACSVHANNESTHAERKYLQQLWENEIHVRIRNYANKMLCTLQHINGLLVNVGKT